VIVGAGEQDVSGIVARAGALFERAHAGTERPTTAELDSVLADGYACVLALEADRASLARRSTDLFASAGPAKGLAKELRALNALLLARDRDIARLRAVLAELREWADARAPLAR
jgi:hypothetical protein